MASAVSELKVLISVVQDPDTLRAALSDLKSLKDALFGIDQTTLNRIGTELKNFAGLITGFNKDGDDITIDIPTKLVPPDIDPVDQIETGLEKDQIKIPSKVEKPDTGDVEKEKERLETDKVSIPSTSDGAGFALKSLQTIASDTIGTAGSGLLARGLGISSGVKGSLSGGLSALDGLKDLPLDKLSTSLRDMATNPAFSHLKNELLGFESELEKAPLAVDVLHQRIDGLKSAFEAGFHVPIQLDAIPDVEQVKIDISAIGKPPTAPVKVPVELETTKIEPAKAYEAPSTPNDKIITTSGFVPSSDEEWNATDDTRHMSVVGKMVEDLMQEHGPDWVKALTSQHQSGELAVKMAVEEVQQRKRGLFEGANEQFSSGSDLPANVKKQLSVEKLDLPPLELDTSKVEQKVEDVSKLVQSVAPDPIQLRAATEEATEKVIDFKKEVEETAKEAEVEFSFVPSDTEKVEAEKDAVAAPIEIPVSMDVVTPPGDINEAIATEALAVEPVEIPSQVETPSTDAVEATKENIAEPITIPVDVEIGKGVAQEQVGLLDQQLIDIGEKAEQIRKKWWADDSLDQFVERLKGVDQQAKKTAESVTLIDNSVSKLTRTIKFLAGGFLGLEIVRTIKDLADNAARTEVLSTVLNVVAKNAGYTSEEISKVDKNVQRLGITSASSKQSLTQFLQSGLKLDYAEDLAKAAQNLATISGLNSSDTFTRLITNIQQLDTMGLRWMGIIVDRAAAEQKLAAAHDTTRGALTRLQQTEAFTLGVLEKAKNLEGAYAAALGDVGKQIQSLDRFTKEYKDALGEGLLPTYLVLVEEVTLLFRQLTVLARETAENKDAAQAIAEVVRGWAEALRQLIVFVAEHQSQIITIIRWYAEFKLAMLALKGINFVGEHTVQLVQFLLKGRLALQALAAGQITLAVAQRALAASSVVAAAEVIKVAIAQQALAASASPAVAGLGATTTALGTTTVAVQGLATAWTAMSAILAVPVISYVVYRTIQDTKEEAQKPFWQQVNDARQRDDKIFLEGKYNDWLATNKELAARIKASGVDPFQSFLQEADRQVGVRVSNEVFDQLEAQKNKVNELTAAYEALSDTGTAAEKRIALERKNSAIEEKTRLERLLNEKKTIETVEESRQRVFDQQERYLRAQREFEEHKNTVDRPVFEKNLKEQSDLQKKVEEEHYTKIRVERKLDPASVERERLEVEAKKKQVEEQNFLTRLQQSNEDLFSGKLFFEGDRVSSGDFSQLGAAFRTQLENITRATDPKDKVALLRENAAALREGLKLYAQAAKTPVDLKNFRETVAEFRKVANTPQDRAVASDSLSKAALSVEESQLQFNAQRRARAKENIKLTQDAVLESIEQELALLKQANSLKENLERDAYNRGLLALDAYYGNREQRIRAEGALEERLAKQQIEALEKQRPANTAQENKALDNQIQEAKNRLEQLRGTSAQPGTVKLQIDQNTIAQETERKQLLEQVKQLKLETDAYFGGQSTELDAINDKYRLMTERLKDIEGAQEAINDARNADTIRAILDWQNQRLEDQVSLQRSLLDLEEARLNSSVNRGALTEAEAMEQRNQLLQRRINSVETTIAGKQKEIRELESFRRTEADRIRKELADASEDGVANESALDGRLEGLTTQIHEVQREINGLNGEVIELMDSIQTYGQELARVFSDSLAQAIQDTISNVDDAKNAFLRLGENLRDNIAGAFSRNVAEKVTRFIVNSTSQKDKEGQVIPGTSSFERIFEILGLKKKEGPLGNRNDRIYADVVGKVEVTNIDTKIATGTGINTIPGVNDFFSGDPKKAIKDTTETFTALSKSVKDIFTVSPSSSNSAKDVFGAIDSFKGLFADGGFVSGPGTGTSDSIPARLSDGEYVMTAAKTKMFFPVLEAMRAGKLDKFAKGEKGALEKFIYSNNHSTNRSTTTNTSNQSNFRDGGVVTTTTTDIRGDMVNAAKYALGGLVSTQNGVSVHEMVAGAKYALGGIVKFYHDEQVDRSMSLAHGGLVGPVENVQSIAIPSIIPKTYAHGGVVATDAGASSLQVGSGQSGPLMVQLHPDAMNMTMREWLESEAVRQEMRR